MEEDEYRRVEVSEIHASGGQDGRTRTVTPPSQKPAQCTVRDVDGGGAKDTARTRHSVDDAVSMELQPEAGGGGCMALMAGLASLYHGVLGKGEKVRSTCWRKQMT